MPDVQYYLGSKPLYTKEDVERFVAERIAKRVASSPVYFCQRCGQKIMPGTAMPDRADLHAGSATCINLLLERIATQEAIQYEVARFLSACRNAVHEWNPAETDMLELDDAIRLLVAAAKGEGLDILK